MKKILLMLIVFIAINTGIMAATPIKLALLTPIEIPQDDVAGLSLNILYGRTNSMTGLELGLGMNSTGNLVGIQWMALVNKADRMTGIQGGMVNIGQGVGIQLGAINYSKEFTGIQLGIINYAERLQGIQLGLANINFSGPIPVFPIINFSFQF